VRVLIVEDHRDLAVTVADGLRREGMAVDVAFDGQEGLRHGIQDTYDVVVLDRDLPGLHGDEVCRALVASGARARVLMLTAADTIESRVDGLSLGADDYLPKPFALDELLARIRALLRRAEYDTPDRELHVADLRIDEAARRAWRGDQELELTKTEFDLLQLLARNDGIVLSHTTIYERIWGYDFGSDSKSLAVYIGYLRRKTEANDAPRLIHTVRGVGYTLRAP
jgi:two-component system response regulator MprA